MRGSVFLRPTRSLARDPRKLATRMTDEPKPDYPSEPTQTPATSWSPEPWVESDPARHWARSSELIPPAGAAPTQPLYDVSQHAPQPLPRMRGPWRAFSVALLALVLILGGVFAGGRILAAHNSA